MSAEIRAVMDVLGEEVGTALIVVMIAMLVLCLFLFIYVIVTYVFNGLGMYAIAKRRGILHPWLAWVPVGSLWLLGSIADQYNGVVKDKHTKRRWVLLIACIVYEIINITVNTVTNYLPVMGTNGTETALMANFFLETMLCSLIMIVFGIVYSVFHYIALYDVYRSCNPKRAVTFLLLSIFLGVTEPFLVFGSRNQDFGMVPEKKPEEPVYQIPPQFVPDEACTAEESDFAEPPVTDDSTGE